MNTQKSTIISRIGISLLVLLLISIFYSGTMFLISSGPLPPWQSPEISPRIQSDIASQPDTLQFSAMDNETKSRIFSSSENNQGTTTIIRPFRQGNYTITLTDRRDEILEYVSGDGGTWQYSLQPECINRTNFDEQSLGIPDTTAGIVWYRVLLQLPVNGSHQPLNTIDMYDVWVEREWNMGMNKNLIHTEGRFFGIYGQEIIEVIDKSYSVSSQLFDQNLASRTETGHGNAAGWISTDNAWTLRNFPLKVKYSTISWITVDIYYNTRFGISSDKWFSTSIR